MKRYVLLFAALTVLFFFSGCSTTGSSSSTSTGNTSGTTTSSADTLLQQASYEAGMLLLSLAPNASDKVIKGNWLWYLYGVVEQLAGNPQASIPQLTDAISKALPNDGSAWATLATSVSDGIQTALNLIHGEAYQLAKDVAIGLGEAATTVVPAQSVNTNP